MNLREYKGSFTWVLVVIGLVGLAAVILIFWAFIANAAVAADNVAPCLTKEQARAKYPGAWLYWHGTNRCWDNAKGRTSTTYASKPATWGKQNSLKLAKPSPDPNGNVYHHSGRPIIVDPPQPQGPSVAYPSLMAGGGTGDEMLNPESITRWPPVMDMDEPAQFIPWQKRFNLSVN